MGKGIFITGTDTGVGKTFIAAGLIRSVKSSGHTVCPMKPVETGCPVRNGRLVPGDTLKLIKEAGISEGIDRINPYRMRHPLAPSVAAESEGIKISRQRILSNYRYLKKRYEFVIIEGAGGLMVPIWMNYLFLDLVRDLEIPLIIVARAGLGTINHTMLTMEAARNNKLRVVGIIINYTSRKRRSMAERTNPAVIEKLSGLPVLGIVPYTKGNKRRTENVFSAVAQKSGLIDRS